ncbi:THO complex 6 homolog, partial [Elysia marginata]
MSNSKDPRHALQYLLHSAVYDICFSPCGNFLAAANKFGDVALFSLTAALSPSVQQEAKCPVFIFNVYKNGGIYCLTSTETELICAGEGDIQAYRWSDIIAKSPKVAWALSIPQKGVFSHPEINSCVIDSNSEHSTLYAGAGDNNIYAWDIASGQYK